MIPTAIRDRIGGPGLTPTWRLWGRPDPFNDWEILTDRVITEGPAISLTLDARTAPSRRITITEVSRPGVVGLFEDLYNSHFAGDYLTSLRSYQFAFYIGWADEAGAEYFEDMGRYWIEEITLGEAGQFVTVLASVETLFLRLYDLPDTPTAGYLPSAAADALATADPVNEFAAKVVARAVAGTAWEFLIGWRTATTAWVPATADELPTAWGTQLWAAIAELATRAGWSVVADDVGWLEARRLTDPQTIAGTISDGPAGTIIRHTGRWRPDVEVSAAGVLDDRGDVLKVGVSSGGATVDVRSALVEDYRGNVTTPDLGALAVSALRRHNLLADDTETTAAAMPWLRADDLVTFTRDGITDTRAILAITFDVMTGEMETTLRRAG